MIYKRLFPGGTNKALTLSYDDGVSTDKQLIALMKQYGIKGTFNVNSGKLTGKGSVRTDNTFVYTMKEEEYGVYEGMELAVHGYTHPFFEQLPADMVINEIVEDRRNIERIAGYPVHGMAYPFGSYNESVLAQLRQLGIVYSRTTKSTYSFGLPEDFLLWHPTCHHNDKRLFELADKFLNVGNRSALQVFYLWGHTYEFAGNYNWNRIEDFFRKLGGRDDIWYATNMEIYRYVKGLDRLETTLDCKTIYNPNAFSVWLEVDDKPVEIKAGETVKF